MRRLQHVPRRARPPRDANSRSRCDPVSSAAARLLHVWRDVKRALVRCHVLVLRSVSEVHNQKFIIRRSKSEVAFANRERGQHTASSRSRHVPVSCRTSHVAVGWRGWPSLGQARQPRVALPICVSRFSGSHGFECPYLSILWG